MEKSFFINNRENLAKNIEDNSITILFAGRAPYKSADETYMFTPNRNFYYLTGIARENLILVMIKRDNKMSSKLFIERNDPVMARWVGEKISKEECSEISGIESVDYLDAFNDEISSYMSRTNIETFYFDLERQEIDIPYTAAQEFANKMKSRYPQVCIKNVYHIISDLRTIKSEEEIELTRKAIDITYEGIKAMWRNAKPGMMEYEIEAHFDYELKKNGVTDYAFKTITGSGKNGTVLHYSSNDSMAHDGDLVLLDLGAQYKYYNADISRTFPVNGKFTERQKAVYDVVLKANEAVTEAVKPGISYRSLEKIARDILIEGCKELGLIKEDSEISKYYFHSVTHFLGLDCHDVGPRDVILKEGMMFTNEPGLYIPEEGIGVRIEDDILVTKDGHENLSAHIIKKTEDIERFMAEGK